MVVLTNVHYLTESWLHHPCLLQSSFKYDKSMKEKGKSDPKFTSYVSENFLKEWGME